MRGIIFAFFALTSTLPAAAQQAVPHFSDCSLELSLDDIAQMRPRTQGQTPQGLAICDGVIFALYHGGSCAAIQLDNGCLLGEFQIDGADGTHCNNASFGIERPDSASRFPLLYVSECYAPCRCFVEEITTEGSRLAATIIYTGSGIDSFCDWCVDRDNRHIYAYGRTPERGVVLKRFDLPTLDDADTDGIIRLGDDDVLQEFVYPQGFFGIAQGSHIRDGLLYLPTGVPSSGSCCIHVVSLADGSLLERHCIDDIGLEPEGLCFVGDRLWQFFAGGKGTLYSFGLSHSREKL